MSASKYAIVSVFNKRGVGNLSRLLLMNNYTILSTGGTYKQIKESIPEELHNRLVQVSDFTKFPEILGGRVKTLHPKIYGGLLARRDQDEHVEELRQMEIPPIDLVVCNLYPFHKTTEQSMEMNDALELIDIGGVTLLRAAAKNWPHVTVLSDPEDYDLFQIYTERDTQESDWRVFRRDMAGKAFDHTSEYDRMIRNYLYGTPVLSRTYFPQFEMKYGCNPHQTTSYVATINGSESPIVILNGTPGYINLLDALNSWQLVHEAGQIWGDGRPVVASFKHTSPAGVAIPGRKENNEGSLVSSTFKRARSCDPMSSFGDFIAVNGIVDIDTAKVIKSEVSDGIIASSFSTSAITILSQKKGGNYLILQVDPNYKPTNDLEIREMFGVALSQTPNRAVVGRDVFTPDNIPTSNKMFPETAKDDLLLANITLKYAQSNNVVMAKDGQIIGVAAGQQSRVDAVKLAGRKACTWWLRKHPKTLALNELFKPGVKRQEKVNASIRYVEGDFTPIEKEGWNNLFTSVPDPLTDEEKQEFLKTLTGVSMASDAFFPFRDNIDHASKFGVKYIIQPGGSVQDKGVIEACDQYDMAMVMSGSRMFTH